MAAAMVAVFTPGRDAGSSLTPVDAVLSFGLVVIGFSLMADNSARKRGSVPSSLSRCEECDSRSGKQAEIANEVRCLTGHRCEMMVAFHTFREGGKRFKIRLASTFGAVSER
jgi:hypothetical protein